MPSASKSQNSKCQSLKKRFINQEGANQEDGRPNPQFHFMKVQRLGFFVMSKKGKMGGVRGV